MLRRTPLAAAVSGVLAAAALPTVALAQSDLPGVEEIVVTATRRAQNIQDIPINIASFDGNTLETRARSPTSPSSAATCRGSMSSIKASDRRTRSSCAA